MAVRKQLVTPGQAAHRAAGGAPLGGASSELTWEITFNDDQRDGWERIARHAIRQFNAGSPGGITPGHVVFDSGYNRGHLSWVELPESYRDHYERIAQAAIDTLVNTQ